MLGLTLIGVLLSSVFSLNLIGVNYSFDFDFEKVFNNEKCEKHDNWNVVEYADLRIASPRNSQTGIRSRKVSCTTSFPIIFFDSSVLQFNIFLDVIAEASGLNIIVFEENGISDVRYSYNKSNSNFKPGWNTLSIAIHKNITGYINLLGHCHDQEIVIVDSFQYITKPIVDNPINDEFSKTATIYEPDLMLENIDEPLDLLFEDEGSGDEGSGEEFDINLGEDLEEEDDQDEKGVTKIED